MSRFEIKLPKMGESVAEATITSWLKNVGDRIDLDEAIVEIATDKVDSEVPSEVEGTIVEILFDVDAVVKVGETIAIIETLEDEANSGNQVTEEVQKVSEVEMLETEIHNVIEASTIQKVSDSGKFFSPLVRNIATKEGISMEELEAIIGTGKDDRVTKNDILAYIDSGRQSEDQKVAVTKKALETKIEVVSEKVPLAVVKKSTTPVSVNGEDEIIEMSRMGKLIAHHMVESIQTSAHVQSFIEVDVTNIVNWRNKVKDEFYKREGEKITYTPIFMQAVAIAIKEHPMINISVDGDKIIKRKAINLGMAAALSDGNLIVPVIKNADQLNLVGITKAVNDLASRARKGKLNPDDIQGGTYTVTNVGSFGSVFGTPIINQPQVAILALGAVRKVPAVIETPEGDFIGIRHKMFISHSYDHRVVNGALGGMFIKTIKDSLEAWDIDTKF
ncbi:2-oxoglutarate dehydrogenase E2 component (dihydrolipoamide succinyltransferase) [Lutibacter agarilyticus]|uniref:Dihydrolipoamide acetyltransferase component of pyruvate dehydrogenase complex n=1 Tax=Lutibacter agarilyticus TaxID=1109740 RepID=A0A238X198_9FLAO|nr:dihydrolipoamide acetyltransferase family protein [Lutibacter agarilyticus]SNR52705.1 2-oxoglutarate dehydrogenase E2 component (dihydrolipoamide succinyltransferase) [Lutibacter agarilyticus]